MAGSGGAWGSRDELLHPRDRHGRFRSKWKMGKGVVDKLMAILDNIHFRTFKSDDESANYLRGVGQRKPGAWTTQNLGAINAKLRAGQDGGPQAKAIDAAMQPLPDDVILNRVVGPEAFKLDAASIGNIEEYTGKLIADKGYSSSNIGTPMPHQGPAITMVIAAPRGTRAAVPKGQGSREVVLDKDQPLRVTRVQPDGKGGYYVMAVATSKSDSGTKPMELGKDAAPSPTAPSPVQAPVAPQGVIPGGQPAPNAPGEAPNILPAKKQGRPAGPPPAPRTDGHVAENVGGGGGTTPAPEAPAPVRVQAPPAPPVPEREVPGQGAPEAPSAPEAPPANRPRGTAARVEEMRKELNPPDFPADRNELEVLQQRGALSRRAHGDVAARIAEMEADGASDTEIADEIDRAIREHGDKVHPEDFGMMARDLMHVADDYRAGDRSLARRRMTSILRDNDIEMGPKPGATVRYDPRIHGAPRGVDLQPGDQVKIVVPEAVWKPRGTEPRVLAKAAVAPAQARGMREQSRERRAREAPVPGRNAFGDAIAKEAARRDEAAKKVGGVEQFKEAAVKKALGRAEPLKREVLPTAGPPKKRVPKAAVPKKAPATPGNIDKMTVAQLREEAKRLNVPLRPGMKKADILDAVRNERKGGDRNEAGFKKIAEGAAKKTPTPAPAKAAPERLIPGMAAGKTNVSRVKPGEKILVKQNADGTWSPATGKRGATVLTVTGKEAGGNRRIVLVGTDPDGNEIRVRPSPGHQTFWLHQEPAVKKAAPKAPTPKPKTPTPAPAVKKAAPAKKVGGRKIGTQVPNTNLDNQRILDLRRIAKDEHVRVPLGANKEQIRQLILDKRGNKAAGIGTPPIKRARPAKAAAAPDAELKNQRIADLRMIAQKDGIRVPANLRNKEEIRLHILAERKKEAANLVRKTTTPPVKAAPVKAAKKTVTKEPPIKRAPTLVREINRLVADGAPAVDIKGAVEDKTLSSTELRDLAAKLHVKIPTGASNAEIVEAIAQKFGKPPKVGTPMAGLVRALRKEVGNGASATQIKEFLDNGGVLRNSELRDLAIKVHVRDIPAGADNGEIIDRIARALGKPKGTPPPKKLPGIHIKPKFKPAKQLIAEGAVTDFRQIIDDHFKAGGSEAEMKAMLNRVQVPILKELAKKWGVNLAAKDAKPFIISKIIDAKLKARNLGGGTRLHGANLRGLRQLAKDENIRIPSWMKHEDAIRQFIEDARKARIQGAAMQAQSLAHMPAGHVFPVKARKWHVDVDDIQDLVKAAEVTPAKEKRLGGGAIGITRLKTAPNGYKYVWKQDPHFGKNAIDAEQAGPMVARVLGLESPDIYRNEDEVIHMAFVDNADVAANAIPNHPGIYDSDDAKRLAILDFLIVNSDRHRGNWMIRNDGRIIPIDHGFAFEKGRDTKARSVKSPADMQDYIRFATNTFRDAKLLKHIADPGRPGVLGDNPLTKADIAKLRIRIAELRPRLEKIGKGYFVDNMLMRLALLEPHAKGTTNLIP